MRSLGKFLSIFITDESRGFAVLQVLQVLAEMTWEGLIIRVEVGGREECGTAMVPC